MNTTNLNRRHRANNIYDLLLVILVHMINKPVQLICKYCVNTVNHIHIYEDKCSCDVCNTNW